MPTTQYPGALDVFTDPSPATLENVVSHAAQHDVANDAILALETKLGTGQAAGTKTLITNVTANQAITPDLSLAQVFRYNLSANVTAINAPINSPANGAIFTLQFIQDSLGGRTWGGFNAAYNSSAQTGYFPSPAPNSVDTITLYWDGTTAWAIAQSIADIGWTPVSFQNNWTNFGGVWTTAQYRKMGSDIYIRGTIKGGTLSQPAFTLPVGYRVPGNINFPCDTGGACIGVLGVGPDGTCTPFACSGGTNSFFSISSIRYSLYGPV